MPEIPTGLDQPEFLAAWESWQTHRREIRKPLTATSAAKQLKQLDEMGIARAVAAIDHSITKGWTGIFEKESRHANQKSPTSPTAGRVRQRDYSQLPVLKNAAAADGG